MRRGFPPKPPNSSVGPMGGDRPAGFPCRRGRRVIFWLNSSRVLALMQLSKDTDWLRETDEARFAELWHRTTRPAKRASAKPFTWPDSSSCRTTASGCARTAGSGPKTAGCPATRMSREESAGMGKAGAAEFGYGTVVLQSGENPGITADWMADWCGRSRPSPPPSPPGTHLWVPLPVVPQRHAGEGRVVRWRSR